MNHNKLFPVFDSTLVIDWHINFYFLNQYKQAKGILQQISLFIYLFSFSDKSILKMCWYLQPKTLLNAENLHIFLIEKHSERKIIHLLFVH